MLAIGVMAGVLFAGSILMGIGIFFTTITEKQWRKKQPAENARQRKH